MKRTLIISGIVVTLAIIALVVFNRMTSKKSTEYQFAEVKKGLFEITVTAAGELIPEKSIDIKGPDFAASSGDDHGSNQGRGGVGGNMRGGSEMRMMDLK